MRKIWELLQAAFNTVWDETDNLTKWIQVIALCVAAWWAFTNYSVADKPSLEPNLSVDFGSPVDTDSWVSGTCVEQYSVTVINQGKVSFDVTEVHFRAWRVDTPVAQPQEATFVNSEEFSRGDKIMDLPITSSAILLKHFAPGQRAHQDFTWIFRQQKPGITSFTVEVGARSGSRRAVGYGQAWKKDLCRLPLRQDTVGSDH